MKNFRSEIMKEINTSSYLIPVKLDSEKDKYMLIHGYTGAMDIVSSKVLSAISSTNTDRLSDHTIQFLLKRGYLNLSAMDESSLLDVSANDCEHCSGWGACNFRGAGN